MSLSSAWDLIFGLKFLPAFLQWNKSSNQWTTAKIQIGVIMMLTIIWVSEAEMSSPNTQKQWAPTEAVDSFSSQFCATLSQSTDVKTLLPSIKYSVLWLRRVWGNTYLKSFFWFNLQKFRKYNESFHLRPATDTESVKIKYLRDYMVNF